MSTTSSSTPPALVGRDRERGVLREHLDAALARQGSLILMSGEAGIGKTALAEAMAAIARVTGGNFRLLQRLFGQIARLLDINHLRTITAEVVQAARESLVIGDV